MKIYVPQHKFDMATRKFIFDPQEEPQMEYDQEAFDASEVGQALIRKTEIFNTYQNDPMNPAVIEYWKERGMKKELFDMDIPLHFGEYAYSVFTPLDMDPEKKYALVYVCHGGGSLINFAETYGFNELAAREKFIVVYAFNGGFSNEEVDTEFPRIMKELREKGYPIDWERVYTAGFSSGSEAAAVAACTWPEMVASIAVLPGGQPFKHLKFFTGPEYYASTRGLRIPGCFIGGTADIADYPAPWILDFPRNEDRAKNLDIWLREMAQIKNYQPVTLEGIEELLKSDDPIAQEFGMKFDRTYSFRAEGRDWIGGEFYGEDGAPVMRQARAFGVPHIVWDSQINIVWDYLKHFRRDQETGASIYDAVACWGES